jgi:hypothetical protein
MQKGLRTINGQVYGPCIRVSNESLLHAEKFAARQRYRRVRTFKMKDGGFSVYGHDRL